ncbi:MAG: sigma-54 dependent transcriptional regulator, partial [Planctomycetota bacterium]|nr:sigma-54 dependent transcriptional regulator [Planctomycetota bacterium]
MSRPANILVVDDEATVRDGVVAVLKRDKFSVQSCEDGETAAQMFKAGPFDIAIVDLKLPGMSGMDVLKKIKEDDPNAIVIMISGYATVASAVEAMKAGAYDLIPKPFTPEELRVVVRRALERRSLFLENVYLRQELDARLGEDIVVGKSPAMRKIMKLVDQVGPSDSTVLLIGESGTGKELIARTIHQKSARRDNPFVVVDCGSLVETLFESELFGHVKGAFTGAIASKPGRFELANGGTLFLDEITNISMGIQAKLLRAIQEREICRVGSSLPVRVDIRIIAASNKDLAQCIRDGVFREDLFYRLSVVPINLPNLRERKEDVPLLARTFIEKYSLLRKKHIEAISPAAMAILTGYYWPGNIRELENTIERAVVLSQTGTIDPSDILWHGIVTSETAKTAEAISLAALERKHIEAILKATGGNISKAARILDIARKTLRTKMARYAHFQPETNTPKR